jgi:quercetin dioxygenase-like cupin family protein
VATEHTLPRPFRPLELDPGTLSFFELPALAGALREEDEYQRSGVAAVTVARDGPMTLVLVALRKGARMREHRAPSAAGVVVLTGRVAFLSDREPARRELGPGALATFASDVPHAVEALEDAAYLVMIGGRERPAAARSS